MQQVAASSRERACWSDSRCGRVRRVRRVHSSKQRESRYVQYCTRTGWLGGVREWRLSSLFAVVCPVRFWLSLKWSWCLSLCLSLCSCCGAVCNSRQLPVDCGVTEGRLCADGEFEMWLMIKGSDL